jgi:hypothetical protein
LTFDGDEFDDSVRANVVYFVGFSAVDVDEFDFAVFGAEEDEVGVEDGGHDGADHGIVLDFPFDEDGFDLPVGAADDLVDAEGVVEPASDELVAVGVEDDRGDRGPVGRQVEHHLAILVQVVHVDRLIVAARYQGPVVLQVHDRRYCRLVVLDFHLPVPGQGVPEDD